MGLSTERSCVRFPVDRNGVRKGIRSQMLLCHTSIKVCRPALILEIKKTKCHPSFSLSITGYRDYKWTWVFIASIGFTSPWKRLITVACYWCSFLSNGHERDQSKDSCLYGRHAKGIIHDIRMTKINWDLVWGLRLWQAGQAPVWVKVKSQRLSSQSQVGAQLCQVKSWLMTWMTWLGESFSPTPARQ